MARKTTWMTGCLMTAILAACTNAQQPNGTGSASTPSGQQSGGAIAAPLTTRNMEAVKGQQAACNGPREKTFNLDVIETTVDLGYGNDLCGLDLQRANSGS